MAAAVTTVGSLCIEYTVLPPVVKLVRVWVPNAVRAYPLEDASVVSPDQGPQPHVMRRGPVDHAVPTHPDPVVVLAVLPVMDIPEKNAFEHHGVQGSIPTPHFHTGMLAR